MPPTDAAAELTLEEEGGLEIIFLPVGAIVLIVLFVVVVFFGGVCYCRAWCK